MKQFPTVQINNEEDINSRSVNMLQDNIVNAINPLLALPLSNSNLLQNISLKTGSNSIDHGLNRKLIGWIITRNNANVTFFDTQDANPLPAKNLLLTASGNATISLVVF